MANNSLIVHLNGDSSNLENALNSARNSISDLQRSGNKIDDIQKSFDKVSNSTMPLRRKIAEIKKQMEQMAVAGLNNTKEGKEMWERLSQSARQYDETLRKIQADTRNISDENSKVKTINGNSLDLKGIGGDLLSKSGLGGVGSAIGSIASAVNPATVAISAIGGVMITAGKASAEFENSLTSLSALTGLSGDELTSLGDSAKKLAKTYGSSAKEVIASMETIGSQAPELLKNKEALVAVTDAANVLAKAGGMSVDEAAKAITTTMNQMGVSASEAMNIVNTLGAGSQQGAAGIQYLNTAFEKAGTQAKAAGMSYGDLAAAIKTIAPKFSSADVAGTALNGTLLKLSQAEDKYNPQVVGLSQALENLSNAQLNNAQMSKLVGESNITMLTSLIEGRSQFDEFSKSLIGTTTAQDQANLKMKTFGERINRLKSSWEDFLISLGQTSFIQHTMDLIGEIGEALMGIISCIGDVFDAFCSLGDNQIISSFDLIKGAFNVITDIIKGVCVAVEVIIRTISKLQQKVKQVVEDYIMKTWNNLKNNLGDTAWYRAIKTALNNVKKFFKDCIDWVVKKWNALCDFLGMDDKKVIIETQITEMKEDAPTPTNNNGGTNSSKGGGSSSKSKKGNKNNKTEKIDYLVSVDDGSLDVAEKKLSAWQNKLKITPTTDKKAIDKCNQEIAKWKKEVEERKSKIEVSIQFENGSIADLQNQFKKIEEAKKKLLQTKASAEEYKAFEDKLKKIKENIEKEEIRLGIKPKIEDGSLNAVKKKIKEKEEEIALALNSNISTESMKKMQSDLDKFRKEEEAKEIELGIKVNTPTISKEETKFQRGSIEDKRQSLDNANTMIGDIQQNFRLGLIGKEEAINSIKEINSKLQELGLKPIYIDFDSSTLDNFEEKTKKVEEKWKSFTDSISAVGSITSNIGSAFSNLGNGMDEASSKAVQFAGQAISSASSIIETARKITFAKQAEAMATGTAEATKIGFPQNIPAILSIIATIASVFASIPKFEKGGIVPGSSFHGDKIISALNSGEGVLTRKGINTLYNNMQNAEFGSNLYSNVNVSGEFTVKGSNLKACLNNYNSKMSKIK